MGESSRSSPHAIVIDMSLITRKIIEVCLGREGIGVVSYADPLEALRAMARSHGEGIPDLAFVEVEFPQSPLGGYTMVQILRSRASAKALPIIMISRRDGIFDRLLARLAGANDYLVKPLTTQALLGTVHRYLR